MKQTLLTLCLIVFAFPSLGQTTFSGGKISGGNISNEKEGECSKLSKYKEFLIRKVTPLRPEFSGIQVQVWNPRFIYHPTSNDSIIAGLNLGGNLNALHFLVKLEKNGSMNREEDNSIVNIKSRGFVLNDIEITNLITKMKSKGAKLNLKPGFYAPEIRNSSEGDEFWMPSYKPKDIKQFFHEWEKQLLHFAHLAEKTNTEILTIAYEFHQDLTDNYELEWMEIISNIREVYTGKLSVNFLRSHTGFNSVLLKHVDIIETSLYAKSTNKRNPTITELQKSWFNDGENKNHVYNLCKLSNAAKKPVLIGDIAFLSLDGSNTTWNSFKDELKPFKVDEKEQSDQIEAIFSIVESFPEFISGITLLTWFPFDTSTQTEFHSWSKEIGSIGRSFKAKLAENTVKNWLNKWNNE